jgi:hypothetical protein
VAACVRRGEQDAVEHPDERVVGEHRVRQREAGTPQRAEDLLDRSELPPRPVAVRIQQVEPARVPVTQCGPRLDHLPHALLPARIRPGRELEFRQHLVGDGAEQLLLAREVAVDRHPLDAELTAEPAHAQRRCALAVCERERGRDDPLAGEGLTPGHFTP